VQPAGHRRVPIGVRTLLVIALAGCASATEPVVRLGGTPAVPPGNPTIATPALVASPDVTEEAMAALVSGDFAAVARAFDPDGSPPTAAQVETVWRNRSAGLGVPRSWRIVDRSMQDGFATRIVLIDLERGELECLVSIAAESHRIASMFVTRPAAPASYVDTSRFREVALTIGAPPFELPATLSLPLADGPVPGVVLVHGSGPNDRDETVGANKIFRDLAEGLASAGIAVLRYDKRTYAHGARLSNAITLDDEVVVDAIAAVRTLAAHRAIDPTRVFVIGHSLGGLLAPEIAVRAGGVAGVVLLAPPARAPWDIVRDQMRYLDAPRELRADLERTITRIGMGAGDGTQIMGMPYSYWQDWASRDGIATAKRFGKRVLVLHGDRDYQVTAEDFALWQRGLAGSRTAELVSLVGDNHLLITGHGPSTPLEYKVPAHVDPRAIARIVAWLRR
jgi:dienelactone hydrolase